MIRTSFHSLDTADTEWQVAHLFEHLIIHNFYAMLDAKHIDSNMIMWVRGETFENRLFIDAGFYDKTHLAMFESFLSDIPVFSDSSIDYCLATIAAEDKSLITIKDRKALIRTLNTIRTRAWDTPETQSKKPAKKILSEQRASKQFRDITVITRGEELTEDEQKLFLRLRILISDLTTVALLPIPGIYHRGSSEQARHNDDMAFMTQITVTKGTSLRELRERINTILSLDPATFMNVVRTHFDTFATEPLWQNAPIQYYRHSGIVTTNQEIAKLATSECVASLMSKLRFEVRHSIPQDADHIE